MLAGGFLAAVLAGLFWYSRRVKVPCANVLGADAIGLAFGECRLALSPVLVACLVWLLISTALSLLPVLDDKGTYLLDPVQTLVTLNYCLMVPLLVAVYVQLIRGLGHFEVRRIVAGKRPLLRRTRFWLSQGAFVALALYIQSQAIHSELEYPSPCSPWVTDSWIWAEVSEPGNDAPRLECTEEGAASRAQARAEAGNDLTGTGIVYYALRGLNTSMALGLIITIFITWLTLHARFRGRRLTDHRYPGLGPNEHVQRVGSALVGSIVCGSVIATVYGISLSAHAARIAQVGNERQVQRAQLDLFSQSTWALWAIATLLISIVAVGCIVWLRAQVVRELRDREAIELAQINQLKSLLITPPANAREAKANAESLDKLMGLRAAVSAKYNAAQPWPLPRGAVALLGFASLAQAGNIILAVHTFSRNGLFSLAGN